MVDIIDVGMGNVRSISNIFSRLGISFNIVTNPNALSANTLLLPGVGSALPFMQRIYAKKFDLAIQKHIDNGNKIIGICLGFQVLTEFSEEDGGCKCLGIIKTKTIPLNKYYNSSNHNQWERFSIRKRDLSLPDHCGSLLRCRSRVVKGRVFYNHEYGVEIPKNQENFFQINSSNLSHFASMYSKGNVIGIQFHPEKSQSTGSQLLSLII